MTVSTDLATVRSPVPLLALNSESPAKLAPIAPGYVPSGRPATLMVKIACPTLLVVAVPAALPFSVKLTVFPLISAPFEVLANVAVRIARPPNDPVAGLTVRVVGPGCAVMEIGRAHV